MDWSTLAAYSEEEASHAQAIFKQGCTSLGLPLNLLKPLFDTLECFPPSQIYTGLTKRPSFQSVRIVVAYVNEQDYLDINDIQVINHTIDSCELLQNRQILDTSPLTATASFKSTILTLINVMAGCSKMGLGDEETCGIVDGSRTLAAALFQDQEIVKKICFLHKVYGRAMRRDASQVDVYWSVMAPFAFSYAILLDEDIKSLDTLGALKTILPKNIIEFSRIQEQYFSDCLTEFSLRTRDFYRDNIFSTESEEDLGLSDIPEGSCCYEEQLRAVQETSIMAIQRRVDDGGSLHRKTAARWLQSNYASPLIESAGPGFFQSNRTRQDSTPLTITSTPSVDSIESTP